MSFHDEWASLKAEAAASRQENARMSLASANGGGGADDGKKLHVTPSVLTKRAENAMTVRHDFATADDAAMKEIKSARRGLDGFESATGIDAFTERWQGQMDYLKGVLAHGVAGQLRSAAQSFKSQDLAQAAKQKPDEGGGKGDSKKE
ncbi:hypothetical protein AB0I82_15405 [Streptomyces sp. NPDC050315]|uniref:hypothetical protein n=1 Tax=Streptomyces sp. NPDC050315 TaxID=3155039 RepID=UPI0034419DCE